MRQDGALVEAHDLAQQGAQAFANTPGGDLCYNLVKQIEAKSAGVMTERVWNAPLPSIRVTYRNLTKVYFRLVREDWLGRIKSGQYRGEWLDDARRKAILATKPDLAWSADLPATEDYAERVEDLPAPKELKAGFYFLLASYDPEFGAANNVVSYTDVWASKLALVIRQQNTDGRFGGFVLDAASGEPIEGAEVQDFAWNWNGAVNPGEKVRTDRNGQFSVAGQSGQNNLLYAAHEGQELVTANNLFPNVNNYRPIPQKQAVFFTDRSLYRPGQTIYYKGIAILVDQEGDNYKVLPGERVNVVFSDVNGKEIARQTLGTNDYGSFSGNFTAPRDRLMGRMMIRADGIQGNTWVNVEEYKRPKFQVTLDAPKTAARLGGEVQLEGKAMAYTGAAVGGAKVRYRVVREVRYPDWWYWCFAWRMPHSPARRRSPTARPKPRPTARSRSSSSPSRTSRCRKKTSRSSSYEVSADVTDTNGETRSAQRDGAGRLHGPAGLAHGRRLADVRQTGRDHAGHDHAGRRAAKGRRGAEDLPPQAAGKSRAARYPRCAAVPTPTLRGRGETAKTAKPQAPTPTPDPTNPNTWELGEVGRRARSHDRRRRPRRPGRRSSTPGPIAPSSRRRTASARRSSPCCR